MEDKTLLIEPHYLGSLEYFKLITKYKKVKWEVHEHFKKQTYRNRCTILSPGGVLNLSVPVSYTNRTPFKDVKIDYGQKWVNDHDRAVRSCYGKAAYFDHFYDSFHQTWQARPTFLLDLCENMMTICLSFLQTDIDISHTHTFDKVTENDLIDARNIISPKIPYTQRNIYEPKPYFQNFGSEFVPNLSLLDALMCEGIHSSGLL